MQNDLISRSALMKYLRDYKWEFAMGSDFSKAMEMINAQPTAYNVEKVVEQIKKSATDEDGLIVFDGKEPMIWKSKAIETVRKGGVE